MPASVAAVPALLDTFASAAHGAVFAWRVPRETRRLRRLATPAALALADAFDATRTVPPDAARWTARIEALRASLQHAEAFVSYCDYGAGLRLGATGTPTVTRRVRDLYRAAVPPHEGALLYQLVRSLQPARCLEMGTCLGLSAAYLAAALTENGSGGYLVTLEGGDALARLAGTHLHQLGLTNAEVVPGRFQDTLPAVLHTHAPFGLVFLDGHHDPDATRAYVRQLRPALAPGAVLVFDDIAWSLGMRRAWRSFAADPGFHPTVDLFTVGVACVA